MSTEPDDASLVRAARAGQTLSLGLLLERHRAVLYAVAVGILGCGPAAEDAVQETFLTALSHLGQLRDPAAARGWLLAILKNRCRAQLRRQEPAVELQATEPGASSWIDDAIERTVLRDWVGAALSRLSEPLRLVTMLRYFSDASSYEAIAQICEVPVGTVRSRLSAARSKLAGELLATAGGADPQAEAHRRHAREYASAMAAVEDKGDFGSLRDVLTPDIRFKQADGVERTGFGNYARSLSDYFDEGFRTRPIRITAGAGVIVVDALLLSPAGVAVPCPPVMTQVQFNTGQKTHRITAYYGDLLATRQAADAAVPLLPIAAR